MLKQLSEDDFKKRVAGDARTPVFKEYLADRETPVSVLTRVADNDQSLFLLESVAGVEPSEDAHAVYEKTIAEIDAIFVRLLSASSIAKYMETRHNPSVPTISEFAPEMTADGSPAGTDPVS